MEWFNEDYSGIFNKNYENQEQLLRWCTFLTERHKIALPYSYVIYLKEAYNQWSKNGCQFPSDDLLTAIEKVIQAGRLPE